MNRLSLYRIEDCELSLRTVNVLTSAGYQTLDDVDKVSNEDLLQIPNLGRKSLSEVRHYIRNVCFSDLTLDEELILWTHAHRTLVDALRKGEAVIVPTP